MIRKVTPLLDGVDIRVTFSAAGNSGKNTRHAAVDGVSLSLEKGCTVGLVGESGCGKTTLGRTLARFQVPDNGRVYLDGVDLVACSGRELRRVRRGIQMIFQNPFASLNPRMTVGAILTEAARCAGKNGTIDRSVVERLLGQVGLDMSAGAKYPHEMSGGQRQRVAIARALAVRPKVIIADEPVSSLDVSVAAQIINLFEELKETLHLTMLFISHDLSVVKYVADRILVMYRGRIVEQGGSDDLFSHPMHPYTRNLIKAIPMVGDSNGKRPFFEQVSLVTAEESFSGGCSYESRCEKKQQRCSNECPVSSQSSRTMNTHLCACFFPY